MRKLNNVNAGAIKIRGWIREQMKNDMENGFVGKLDEIVPELIKQDKIYGENRLTREIKAKDVGAITDGGEWEVQFLWWNSETQSNWRDGFIRHAFLTENTEYIKKAKEYVEEILTYQDEDGYMGIYAPDLRFNFSGENGELWAQATLFRGLLAYYEYTHDKRVVDAVLKAVNLTMKSYPIYNSKPFDGKNSYAGTAHGLTFTDVLDWTHKYTGDKKYLEYAGWLFNEYCKSPVSEKDIFPDNLLNPDYAFHGHGVHTYEHLRALLIADEAGNIPKSKEAIKAYLDRLWLATSPSGGPNGDEWVHKRASPKTTGYEYCSIHELLHSYAVLMEKTGDISTGDKIEWLIFNAGQGARDPESSGIAYLKTDNSYSMKGVAGFINPNSHKPSRQTRYMYSPSHKEAAVCCVPNAGRIYPYYVANMWMKTEKGIAATLFGDSEINTEIDGTKVSIIQETDYPFDFKISFNITTEMPIQFELKIRKPLWADNVKIKSDGGEILIENDSISINKLWGEVDRVTVEFETKIKINTRDKKEYYITYGPLLFAKPIKGLRKTVREYQFGTLSDVHCYPDERIPKDLKIPENAEEKFKLYKESTENKWDGLRIKGEMYELKEKEYKEAVLVPIGGTALRIATFKLFKDLDK